MSINNFNLIGKKNNHTLVSDADREIPILGSTDNTGNEVNLVSGIIRLPSDWDRRPMLDSIYLSKAGVTYRLLLARMALQE